MGCDLVEVTAHAGARPSHAVWQGGIYSLSGGSKEYAGLEEATGYGTGAGLCGWNCRHSFFPYYPGISRPAYTPEELEQFNAKTYEYNGVQMTEYEATQKQRYIERQIRRWKREEAAMNAAGLPTEEAKAKVAHWKAVQKDYLQKTGLKRQYDREWVAKAAQPVLFRVKNASLQRYTRREVRELAIATDQIVSKYISRPSKWSGEIRFLLDNSHRDGGKDWNCAIASKTKTAPYIWIHEHLHARSASYFSRYIFKEYQVIEEAAIDLMAQEISKKEGIAIIESFYLNDVNALRSINHLAQIYNNDFEFAIALFNVDMDKRIDWLYNEVMKRQNGLTLQTMQDIADLLNQLERTL